MYFSNLIDFLELFKLIRKRKRLNRCLAGPRSLAQWRGDPSGPVRVAQPLGLVAHSRGTWEPLRAAAPTGCR
jgi:hypothetical protein